MIKPREPVSRGFFVRRRRKENGIRTARDLIVTAVMGFGLLTRMRVISSRLPTRERRGAPGPFTPPHASFGQSQAAPRTPLESPCLAFSRRVSTRSENTYSSQTAGTLR